MDMLLISKYILIIALVILMFAALRVGALKYTSMSLLSSSVLVVVFALILIVIGDLYSINFFKDISLALILFGFVGTIAFAVILGDDK